MLSARRLKLSKATMSLLIANVTIYSVMALLSANPFIIDDTMISLFGQWNAIVLSNGAYWQLFTAMFVHFNILHLLLNMFFLVQEGTKLESFVGSTSLFMIYIVCGLTGNLLTLALGPDVVSAGSSGAVLGICAAILAMHNRFVGSPMSRSIVQMAFLLVLNSILPGVNIMAHLGGIVAGAALGYAEAGRRPLVVWRLVK